MEKFDFSQPIRQSPKGIIVIFAFNAVKFFKNFLPALIALGFALFRKNSFLNLSTLSVSFIVLGILCVLLTIAILKYLNFKFHLDETDFYLDTGIIEKDKTIISKTKIQNVYIQQNFLQQIINVVSLKIETAGDKKSEIEITALSKSTALQLKKELFERKESKIEEEEAIEYSNVFFKISTKRLFLEGLLHNHLKSFVIIVSFAIGIYYEFKTYIENLGISKNIDTLTAFEDESVSQMLYVNILLVSLVLVISIFYSVIRIVIVNFNLEVIENKKTIEINKGLLNKISLSLTPDKIQNIIIKTNALKRRLNLYSLYVKQAMTNEKQKKNFGIIALESQHINHLLDTLLRDYAAADDRSKPSPYYKRIMAFYAFLGIVILNIVTLFIFGYGALIIDLFVLPILVLSVHYRYKKAYYSITESYVTVGSGFIDTTTEILGINKIQAVKMVQNIFQKRKRITSIVIYTASKAVTIPYIDEQEATSIYDFLLFKVESEGKNWM